MFLKVLKCKIKHYFFLQKLGFPNWGEGGGILDLEKNFPFISGGNVPDLLQK